MTNIWHCLPADRTDRWSAFFEQHSISMVKSQCATEQLGPQGLIMDTKYGKKGYDWSKQALTCYEAL